MEDHGIAGLDGCALPLDLIGDGIAYVPDGVHVLHFHLGVQLIGARRTDGDVGVGPHGAVLHAALGSAHVAHQRAQRLEELHGLVGGAEVGLGDDLHQRHTGAIEVNQADGGAALHLMHQLGHIFLHMDVMDAQEAGRAILVCDLDTAPAGEGKMGL